MRIRAPSALDVLESYEKTSPFFLAAPKYTMLAEGIRSVFGNQGGARHRKALPERVQSALADLGSGKDGSPAVIAGAVPFDESLPAHLMIPTKVIWAPPLKGKATVGTTPSIAKSIGMRPVPSESDYLNAVRKAVARMRGETLQKVVLARSLEIIPSLPIDVAALVQILATRNRSGYTFGIDVSGWKGGRSAVKSRGEHVLIGSSPELLVSRSKQSVFANPLAGSARRSADPAEDKRLACALLGSRKNRREHAWVAEAVVEGLRPFCSRLWVPKGPSLIHTPSMWHLSTKIRGQLRDKSTCALSLAMALHPTPAICGSPEDEALSAIRELEGFKRGFYAGFLGWMDASGDGEWAVTIRCGEIKSKLIRIFAGAGVVDQSRPEDELAETSAKFRTMLTALGLETGKIDTLKAS